VAISRAGSVLCVGRVAAIGVSRGCTRTRMRRRSAGRLSGGGAATSHWSARRAEVTVAAKGSARGAAVAGNVLLRLVAGLPRFIADSGSIATRRPHPKPRQPSAHSRNRSALVESVSVVDRTRRHLLSRRSPQRWRTRSVYWCRCAVAGFLAPVRLGLVRRADKRAVVAVFGGDVDDVLHAKGQLTTPEVAAFLGPYGLRVSGCGRAVDLRTVLPVLAHCLALCCFVGRSVDRFLEPLVFALLPEGADAREHHCSSPSGLPGCSVAFTLRPGVFRCEPRLRRAGA
jgi:hypothetical protein